MSALEVGMTGVVIDSHRRSHRYDATVVKVGRKWAYVEPEWLGRFDVETGAQDGGRFSSSATFYTPEGLVRRDLLRAASRLVAAVGITFRLGPRWPEADALALADWVAERFGTRDDLTTVVAEYRDAFSRSGRSLP